MICSKCGEQEIKRGDFVVIILIRLFCHLQQVIECDAARQAAAANRINYLELEILQVRDRDPGS